MKLLITESQYVNLKKNLQELSPTSSGVKDFLKLVKDTPGLLKHLGFRTHKSLEEFIRDNNIEDFDELRDESNNFFEKKSKK